MKEGGAWRGFIPFGVAGVMSGAGVAVDAGLDSLLGEGARLPGQSGASREKAGDRDLPDRNDDSRWTSW